jgi:hypothetical protein
MNIVENDLQYLDFCHISLNLKLIFLDLFYFILLEIKSSKKIILLQMKVQSIWN